MNSHLQITAMLDQPGLLETLVEKLADRNYDMGYSKAPVPASWRAIDASSVETYVSGIVALADDNEAACINMPFITSFLFTCTKEKGGKYRLTWSSSLS
jgi:hypothetical protein